MYIGQHSLRKILSLLFVASVFLLSVGPATAANSARAKGSLIVKLRAGVSTADEAQVIAANGGTRKARLHQLRLHVVKMASGDLQAVLAKYKKDPRVEAVEVDQVRKAAGIPDDPAYPSQWALPKIGWDKVAGVREPAGAAIVAVLDSGVDASHPDLAGRVMKGTSFLDSTNGLTDSTGHGTAMAGIIAAVAGNGMGGAGVAPAGVKVLPVTVLDAEGEGLDSDIIAGIRWAADNGAHVILMPFSNPTFSQSLQDAIDYAWSKGAVLVAATGNGGSSAPTFPAGDRGVVGVAATDQNDLLYRGSNYGDDVYLAAPGVGIFTTGMNGSYTSMTGTSASSAVVAAVAGFMKAMDPALTNGVIVGRLGRTADQTGNAGEVGNGRVNMAKAVEDASISTVQPSGVSAGGAFIDGYVAAGACTSLRFPQYLSGTIQTTAVGMVSTAIDIEAHNGNTKCTLMSATVKLSSSSSTGTFYSDSGKKTPITTIDLDGGTGQNNNNTHKAIVYYSDSTVGKYLLTAEQTGLTSGVMNEEITSKAVATVALGALTHTYDGTAKSATATTTPAGLSVVLSYNGTAGTTYGPTAIPPTDAGSYTVSATVTDPAYAGSASGTLTIAKAPQTITVAAPAPPSAAYDTTFTVAASASGGAVTYSSGTPAVCSNSGATFRMLSGTGTCVVQYDQIGSLNYLPAQQVSSSTTAAKAAQATVTATAPAQAVFGDVGLFAGATGGSGSGAYSYNAGASTACSVEPSTGALAFTSGTGTCSVTASRAADVNYAASAASAPAVIAVGKRTQTINFDLPSPVTYGAADFTVTATGGGSGNPLTFASSDTSVATINAAGVVQVVGAGSAAITVSQGGNGNYSAAADVSRSLVVDKAVVTVTANNESRAYGEQNPAFSASYIGFLRGDTSTVLSGLPSLTTTADRTSPVGSYPIVAAAGDLSAKNYSFNYVDGTLLIIPATPVISASPVAKEIVFGESLASSTLTGGTASTEGTYSFADPATVPAAAGTYRAAVTFTPLDAANYNAATLTVDVPVARATPTITALPTATGIVYGQTLSASTLTGGSGSVEGSFSFKVPGTAPSTAGSYSAVVIFTPSDSSNYTTATATVNVAVAKATPSITSWPAASGIKYGESLSSSGLTGGTASVAGAFTFDLPDAVPAAVGPYSAAVTFTPTDPGYTPVSDTVIVQVAKGSATVALGNLGQTYDGTPRSVTATTVPANLQVEVSYDGSSSAPTAAGSYAVTATINDANFEGSASGTLVVAKGSQIITFGALAEKTYGAGDFGPGASASSGLPVVYTSSAPAVATVTAEGLIHIVGAGSATITATQGGDDNRLPAAAVAQALTVRKAVITVTASNASRAYGEPNPDFSANYSGLMLGETAAAVISGTPGFTTTATAGSTPGSYPITPEIGSLSADNYTFVFAPGTLAVDLASQMITFNPIGPKTYGAGSFPLGYTGGASGQPVSFTSSNTAVATIDGSTVTIVGAGSTMITATQPGDSNYASATAQQTLTVEKAVVTVTANDQSRPYNTPNRELAVSYSGFIDGETAANLEGEPVVSTSALQSSPVGSYSITVSAGTLKAANYTFRFVDGILAVGQASQTVSITPFERNTYGALPFDITATGGDSGNTISFTSSNPTVATVSGSTVTIVGAGTTEIVASQAGDTNYAPGTARQTLTVEKAPLMVAVAAASRPYGAENPAFTAAYTGFVNNENEKALLGAPQFSTTAAAGSPVGEYEIVVSRGNLFSNNYEFSYGNGKLVVEKATPVITWNTPSDIIVGSPLSGSELNGSASVPGTFSYTPDSGEVLSLGSQTLSTTFTPQDSVNYSTATMTVALNVVPKNRATITLGNLSQTYDGSSKSVSVTTTPAPLEVTVSYSGTAGTSYGPTATAPTAAGTYTVTATVNDPTYQGTASGTLLVARGAQTITVGTPAPASAPYNSSFTVAATAPGGSVKYSSGTGTICTNVGATFTMVSGSGTCVVQYDQEGNGNYLAAASVTNNTAAAKAAQGVVTVSAPVAATYGETGLRATAEGGSGSGAYSYSAGASTACSVDPSTGALTFTSGTGSCSIVATRGADAYYHLSAPSAPAAITVGKQAQIISFESLPPVTYGAADFALRATGGASGKPVTYAISDPTVATVSADGLVHVLRAGSATITASQSGDSNYSAAADVAQTLSVRKAFLTVTANDATRAYGEANPAFTAVMTGFVNDENPEAISGAPAFATEAGSTSPVGPYFIIPSRGALTSNNYDFAFVNGILTVTQATPSITERPAASGIVFGEALSASTLSGGKASTAGTFAFTAPSAVPTAAGTYPAAVTFTPADSGNYKAAAVTVDVPVAKATPTITAPPTATGIVYGQTLSASTLTGGKGSVAGSFSFKVPGTAPSATGSYSAEVVFTPSDSSNYTTATATVDVAVAKGTPTITSPPVASGIRYGQSLSSSSLTGGTASVAGTFTFTSPDAVPAAVGPYSAAITFTPTDPGYAPVSDTVTVAVGKGSATVTLEKLGQTYDGTPRSVTATTDPANLQVEVSYDGSSSAPTSAGSYAVTATINDSSFEGSATGTLIVAKGSQTITFGALAEKTYGAGDFGPGASASSGLPVAYTSSAPAVATVTAEGLIHIVGAGSATITATQGGDDNRLPAAAVAQTLTVQKAVITVTATNASRAYGEPNPDFSATYSGLMLGEAAAAVISGTPGFTTTATAGSIPGSYPITPEIGSLSADNYTFVFAPGTLAVGFASQTITFNPIEPKTYGAGSFPLSYTGGASGQPVSFTSSNTAVATVDGSTVTIVGAGSTIITATQPGDGNYASATAQQTLTVEKAIVTVTADDKSRPYNTQNPPFTVSYSGFVSGETAAKLEGEPVVSTSALQSSPVGSYPITVSAGTLAAANYSLRFVDGTLAVGQASQTVSITPLERKRYGDLPFDITATGGESRNPISFTSSNPAVATVSGSTVTIVGAGTTEIVASQPGDTNYAPGTAREPLTVEKAPLVVAAADASRPYGAENPAFTAAYSGFVKNENEKDLLGAPHFSTIAAAGTPVGEYEIVVSRGTLFSNNYEFSYGNGKLVVEKATPVITWSDPADIFVGSALSGTELNASATPGGGSFGYAPAAGTTLVTGRHSLSVVYTPADTANYTTATKTVTLNVVPKIAATVSLTSLSQTYDGAAKRVTVTTTPANLPVEVTYNGSSTVPSSAGSYNVVATINSASYTGSASGTLVVAKGQPVVSWSNPAGITYGAALSAVQLNASATPAGGSFVYTPAAGTVLPAGAGQILSVTYTPADTTNYSTVTKTAAITVAKATPAITWGNPAGITYGTPLSAAQLNATASVPGSYSYSPAHGAILTAGSQTLSVTFTPLDSANYATASATAVLVVAGNPAVNGACGTANGASYSATPVTNLCTAGTASAVSGTGPWSWSCSGLNGGASATCSAALTAPVVTTQPSASFAALKSGTTFTVSRSEGGKAFTPVVATTSTTFKDTAALLPNTIYQYTVTSDTDPTQTVFMTIRTPLYNGWNIIAVPYATSGVNASTFFGGGASAVYEWVPSGATAETSNSPLGSYVTVATLTPGKGYFVKATGSGTTLVYAGNPGPSSASITLKPGWTMVASPQTSNKTNIGTKWLIDGNPLSQAISANRIGGSVYWWNGSAYDSWSIIGSNPVIETWKGYWILNLDSQNHSLTIQ
ncbi:MBG domain-containing protein [Geomonas sp. RF6]|uniref:MBG domain-containing protein n=1 Tax=Geomonas sp. RF6 TaxID=2897342 RepID=UPI001E5D6735|nr:MBG domain-containing protein [Geomonas sp. RF6]UFS71728.1 MBG domain-containing protein [Geomonas sp. RF6]